MRSVYIVPGILGSQLIGQDSTYGRELWLNYTRLCLAQFRRLALAPDGEAPEPDFGEYCLPGLPLEAYYGPMIQSLRRELPEWDVIPWGYDWRKRIETQGVRLANAIRGHVQPAEPCAIVGHSQGGLVARMAWQSLVGTGHQGLVSRIIALGTPWADGSYSIPLLWDGDDPQFLQLVAATQAGYLFLSPIADTAPGYPSLSGLVKVTATWPSLYELLPPPRPGQLASDPGRADLWQVSWWPADRGISSTWLEHAAGAWLALLDDAQAIVPPHVLTTVEGTGTPTPFRLARPELGAVRSAFDFDAQGDGRVTTASASPPAGRAYSVRSGHGDLIVSDGVLLNLPDWISEERAPGDVTQVAAMLPQVTPATLASPIGVRTAAGSAVHHC